MDISIFFPLIKMLLNLIIVIIPLRIAVEFLDEFGIISYICKKISFIAKWFEISAKALVPMVTGWLIGIYMGGPILANYHREKRVTQDDSNKIVSVWMFAHGLIDETAVFAALGASALLIVGIRLFLAIVAVKLIILLSKRNSHITV